MMLDKRTSVVIPCYKNDEFLLEAISSAANQTCAPLEIIVVDDGSPDPLAPPQNWNGSSLVWIRTENAGLGAARNVGIRSAKGEFVGLLDADDLWEPEKLAKQERLLDENPDAVACYTQCAKAPGFYEFGPYPDAFLRAAELAVILWSGQFFPPSSVLMRRKVAVEVGGFREGLRNGEDLDMWFRLFTRGEIVGVPHPLTKYRVHTGQITSDLVRKVMGAKESRRGILQSHSQLLIEGGLAQGELWDAYRDEVLRIFYKREFRAARPMLWDCWKDSPTDWKLFAYWLMTFVPPTVVKSLRDK